MPLFRESKTYFHIKNTILTIVSFILFALSLPYAFILNILGLGYDVQYFVGRPFSALILWLMNITLEIEGEEYLLVDPPVVFVSNHQSTLDMYLQSALTPRKTVAIGKSDLMYIPFLNIYTMLSHTFLVNRENHESAMKTMADIAMRMARKKVSLYIYPEGTRSNFIEPRLLPFKKGAFRIALGGEYDIVPIVIQNYSSVYDVKRKRCPGGVIRVRILPPIPSKGLTVKDTEDLLERTSKAMLEALVDISPKVTSSEGEAANGKQANGKH